MTETEEFLELLTDPLRYSVRKVAFELYNSNHNQLIIHDLYIQQVNELPYYHIILKTDNMGKLFHLHEEMLDLLEEYVPINATYTFDKGEKQSLGKWHRTYYVFEKGIAM